MKILRIATGYFLSLIIIACSPSTEIMSASDLARNSIIIDGHIDVPYRVLREWEDVTGATDGGDFDYPRAIQGGLNAPFMSIYTPASLASEGKSKERAEELITLVENIVATAPDKYAIATSPLQIREQFDQGLISLPLGMENGSPIEGQIENIEYFFEKGIRYITLAHSLSNLISDSSYDSNKAHGGLSAFGEDVVKEMNRLGMIIDISHVSDGAFWDVMAITSVPVIASPIGVNKKIIQHEINGFLVDDGDENMLEKKIIKTLGIEWNSQIIHDSADNFKNIKVIAEYEEIFNKLVNSNKN